MPGLGKISERIESNLRLKLVGFAVVVMISGSSVAVGSYLVVGNLFLLLVTFGATVLTAGVVGIVSYRIAEEVDRLVTEMEAIADGELDREIASDRKDEVGEMFRTLDTTRERLKSRIEEIETQRKYAGERQTIATQTERIEAKADSQLRATVQALERTNELDRRASSLTDQLATFSVETTDANINTVSGAAIGDD